jgi:hypothetical protein
VVDSVEVVDTFDYILEHLLDEGYADDYDSACVIMASMGDSWRTSILDEALKKTDTMNLSDTSSKISELTKRQKDLQSQFTSLTSKKQDTSAVAKQMKSVMDQIKSLRSSGSQLRQIQNIAGNKPGTPMRAREKDDSTPEEKEDYRSAMRTIRGRDAKEKSPVEKREDSLKLRQRGTAAASGRPQLKPDQYVPSTRETSEQKRRSKMGDVAAGSAGGSKQATTYVNASGERKTLNALGDTETNYGGRGRMRVTNRYQQGATGAGEKGSTPAGSTIDPDRKRTTGLGSRPRS